MNRGEGNRKCGPLINDEIEEGSGRGGEMEGGGGRIFRLMKV